MKKAILLMAIVLIYILFPVPASRADGPGSQEAFSWRETLNNLDMQSLEEFKNSIEGELSPYLDKKSVKEWLVDFVSGDWEFDLKKIAENICRFLFKEVAANSSLLSKLIILSVLAALLVNLQSSFSSGVGKVAYLACFLALCAIALGSFKVVLAIGQNTIDSMVTFMLGMLPQMMVLLTGLGSINASYLLFPVLMTTATAFANAIKTIVFPLIIFSALLSLVNHMSEQIKVERMAKFFGQVAQVSLGFFITIFVGVVTLRTVYASMLDKVALRTTRFVTDNAIPIVGKMLGDTVEVAAGYVAMLKDALGIFGVLIIGGIIVFPLIKVVVIALIYKLVAAVVEPMGDSRTAGVLETMSSHLFMMLAAIASVGLMFFIMIAILVGMTSNITMVH